MINNPSVIKSKIKNDGPLTIATGRSRKELDWKNREMLWSEVVDRLSRTNRTGETYEEYKKLPKSEQDQIKDVGGFVGGTLKGGRRKSDAVVWRQIVTLDADFVKGDFWDSVEMMLDCACAVYSTHKHSQQTPRLRLVIPLARPVTPDEYQAVSRRIAADLGIDFFDDTTYQPHRLMYWPSTSLDGEYFFKVQDSTWLDPDMVLARYPDWKDQSYWPESSRTKLDRKKLADKQGDPHEKPGIVGAFCRTYSIIEALEQFLEEVYEPCGDGRYTYIHGTANGGLIVYDHDKFAFSHHGTDPISGKLVNSFDLVRLHKFGLKDDDAEPGTPTVKLPSYTAMVKFASEDLNVKRQMGRERLLEASEEFGVVEDGNDDEWLTKLEINRKGDYEPTIDNVLIILQNDPRLAGKIALNEFARRPVAKGDLPWRKVENKQDGESWHDSDDAALRHYIESIFGINAPSKINDALAIMLEKRKFHPVKDYLEGLWWDGEPRLETILIDYLGAEDSSYTRAVTRKMLAAAVARIFVPGIKFDYMLVLVGRQGIGKSRIIDVLGQRWYSDSLNTVQGKEAYEQLQGAWLLEMGELSATKKAEVEAVKHFISKREDIYRVAYGKRTSRFPRQCIFFGTTNDPEFLRDKTGNRRFWPVDTDIIERKKNLFTDMTQYEVDQIWAEAINAWHEGEKLFLTSDLEAEAIRRQEQHTEESSKTGLIMEYLDTLLPENWADLDISGRRRFIHGTEFGDSEAGVIKRDRVCAMEVWVELFEGDPKQLSPMQAREINDILRRIPGWEPYVKGTGKMKFGRLYGLQRAFIRTEGKINQIRKLLEKEFDES